MNCMAIRSILHHYEISSRKYGTTEDRSSSRVSVRTVHPFERLRTRMDIHRAIVLADEKGEWVKGPAKEMFYRSVTAIKGDWGNAKGLYLIPSSKTVNAVMSKRQPCCYAFVHSYPIFRFPYCVYDLLTDATRAETRAIVHVNSVHPKVGHRDFKILFYHYFDRSAEGQRIINTYNYRCNSNEYLFQQVFHAIDEVQKWSGKTFVSIEYDT